MAPDDPFSLDAPDYSGAFGLIDNPFNPTQFEDVDERALDRLWEAPLALDEYPRLEPLFVSGAGPFEKSMELFARQLRGGGYRSGETRVLGSKSFAFRVVGPQGSGKSTLTNLLVGRLKLCAPPPNRLLVLKYSVRPDLDATVKQVCKRATEHQDGACCLVFDGVRLVDEDLLHELFEDLRKRIPVVMFEIVDHAEDIRRPRPSARVYTDHLETGTLTRDHATTFVTARVKRFRQARLAARLTGEFAAFPFDASEVAAVVSSDDQPGTVTLRTLNWVLHRGIDRSLPGSDEPPVEELDADGLRARLVSAKETYDEVFAEELRASA